MFPIPDVLETNIYSYLDDQDNHKTFQFWQSYFQQYVLINIDIKFYFSKYVLSEIDKGFRLVAIDDNICIYCRKFGINLNCNNCNLNPPCLHCYYYHLSTSPCWCRDNNIWVSWKDINNYSEFKYPRYYDFIKSKEFKNLIHNDYILLNNHDSLYDYGWFIPAYNPYSNL
jgi:hypothetical protein